MRSGPPRRPGVLGICSLSAPQPRAYFGSGYGEAMRCYGVQTERTTLRRHPERGSHERETLDAILDEALVCHVGIVGDGDQPYVIPTTMVRIGDEVFVHGSPASRLLRQANRPVPICVTVTLLDGIVLARSAFHHSVNYRSVVIIGQAWEVTDLAQKNRVLCALVDKFDAGRSERCRPPSERELRATLVLALALDEASAKIRTGGPIDDVDDMILDYWAGVVPVALTRGAPVPDGQ